MHSCDEATDTHSHPWTQVRLRNTHDGKALRKSNGDERPGSENGPKTVTEVASKRKQLL